MTNSLCSLVKFSKIGPIMLVLCLMLLIAYYANYYAGIISRGLKETGLITNTSRYCSGNLLLNKDMMGIVGIKSPLEYLQVYW